MSSRTNVNPYQDFSEKNSSLLFPGDGLDKEIEKKINTIIRDQWLRIENVIPLLIEKGDYSIYTGYAGIAYAYFILGRKTNNTVFLQKAEDLCQHAVSVLKNRRISFLNGDAGPLSLGAVVYNVNGKKKEATSLINRLIDLIENIEDSSIPDEILYGRAGYLYALLFVNKYTEQNTIPQGVIRKVVDTILTSGRSLAKRSGKNVPLMYQWHDKEYLGAAHGFAGILYMLLCAQNHLTEKELVTQIQPTIDWLKNFRYSSFNFASSVGSESDKLVQWCHGAPGFVHLYFKAYKVFKDDTYLKIAEDCSDVVWQRGLITKGYSICHGVSGNAYTFMHLFKHTKDIKQRYRMSCFMNWCTNYPKNQGLIPDRPYSLFEGVAGLIYFLEECKDPLNSSFPAYEL